MTEHYPLRGEDDLPETESERTQDNVLDRDKDEDGTGPPAGDEAEGSSSLEKEIDEIKQRAREMGGESRA